MSSLGFEESACIKARPRVFFQAQRISKFSVLVPCDGDGYSQFFGSSSSKSATSSLREGSESEENSTNEAPPSKRPCAVPSSAATSRKYNKKWGKGFPWLEYDGNAERLKPGVSLHKEVVVCGSQSLSRIGKRQFKR